MRLRDAAVVIDGMVLKVAWNIQQVQKKNRQKMK